MVWYFTQTTSIGHLVTARDGAKMVKCSADNKFKELRSKLIFVEEPPTRMLGCPSIFSVHGHSYKKFVTLYLVCNPLLSCEVISGCDACSRFWAWV